jgi:hypothetical protein
LRAAAAIGLATKWLVVVEREVMGRRIREQETS